MKVFQKIPQNLRAFAVIGLVFIVLFILVVPTFVMYQKEGKKSANSLALFNMTDDASGASKDQINIYMKALAVDLNAGTIKLNCKFQPTGAFAQQKDDSEPILLLPGLNDNDSLMINFGAFGSRNFTAGSVMQSMDLVMNLFNGDLNQYPFESFSSQANLKTFISSNRDLSIPIGLTLDTAIQNFHIKPVINSGSASLFYSMTISRSSTTKGFAIFLVILMWFLSLASLGIAIDIVLRKRKIDPPLLAMFTSLIFALPALRNAAPGAPQIGATIDVLGFFWNMALAGLAALIMMVWYIYNYQEEKVATVKMERRESDDSFGSSSSKSTSGYLSNFGNNRYSPQFIYAERPPPIPVKNDFKKLKRGSKDSIDL